MEEPTPLNSVAAFHKKFKHPIADAPKIPSEARCKLRISLIAEELKELEAAIAAKDLVEVADALADIQYVLSGAVLEFGLGGKFKALFDEVQHSNMSKACKTEEEAKATQQYYLNRDNTESYIEASDGHYLVYRKSDNKTLKSINYTPPNLKSILKESL